MARAKRSGPSRAHYDLLDERCFEVVKRAIGVLEGRHAAYVLTGGWAVRAYGSRVPSVDTDVFLRQADAAAVLDAVQALGITTGQGQQFEALDLDSPNNILGPDPDMQEPERGYVPRAVLETRTKRRPIDLARFGSIEANVPTADALAFMKLKAYHDRELSWRAHRDAGVLARIATSDRPQVLSKTVDYYYRKAGKDLYDIAHLLAHHASETKVRDISEATGLAGDLDPLLAGTPAPALLQFARDMAAEEGDEPTLAKLVAWGQAPFS